jgi:hypothetical protein
MLELNLNIDNWALVTSHEPMESSFSVSDVIALADNISWANSEDGICDFNMHEYTH